MHDLTQNRASVDKQRDAARKVYQLLKVEENLVAVYPPDQREAAYRFIDKVLQWQSTMD